MQNKRVLMCHIWISWSVTMTCSPPSAGRPFQQADQTCVLQELQQPTNGSPAHDRVMHSRTAAAQNYYRLVVAFAQGLPSLPWFRGVASICKQAGGLQAAGAAPWVQWYLLSQPKRSSPQAGTCGSWAHAWLLTLTCLLVATRRCTQHKEVTVFTRVAAFSAAGSGIFYLVVPCCLINEFDLHDIVFWKGYCKIVIDILQYAND